MRNQRPKTLSRAAQTPPSKFSKSKEVGTYLLGVALIGCSVADAALNPFAFITADKLLFAGLALIGADRAKEILK